jgi:hypothetical protein
MKNVFCKFEIRHKKIPVFTGILLLFFSDINIKI